MISSRKRPQLMELPGELLARIFDRCSREERLCSIAFVCKRARRVCDEGVRIQVHTRELTPAFVEWFANRARAVRELFLVGSLDAESEQNVALATILGMASARDAGLQLLCAAVKDGELNPALSISFCKLTELRALSLNNIFAASLQLCSELRKLKQLEFLSLGGGGRKHYREAVALSYTFWNSVAKLRHLRILSLFSLDFLTFIEPSQGMPGIPQLRALLVSHMTVNLPSDLSSFSGLRLLHLSNISYSKKDGEFLTWHIWQLAKLRKISLHLKTHLHNRSKRDDEDRYYGDHEQTFPLALFPAGMETLSLELNAYTPSASDTWKYKLPAWERMMRSAKHSLRTLHLENAGLYKVPDCVKELEVLDVLNLANNAISSLPEGAYLSMLTCLDLSKNRGIESVPPALRSCKRLCALNLSTDYMYEVTPTCAEILMSLPLERLKLREGISFAEHCRHGSEKCEGVYDPIKKLLKPLERVVPLKSGFRPMKKPLKGVDLRLYECTDPALICRALPSTPDWHTLDLSDY